MSAGAHIYVTSVSLNVHLRITSPFRESNAPPRRHQKPFWTRSFVRAIFPTSSENLGPSPCVATINTQLYNFIRVRYSRVTETRTTVRGRYTQSDLFLDARYFSRLLCVGPHFSFCTVSPKPTLTEQPGTRVSGKTSTFLVPSQSVLWLLLFLF